MTETRKNVPLNDNPLDILPAGTPEYMRGAWIGALHWAISEKDAIAAFRAATGNQWTPGKTALDQAIDKATGADKAFLQAFVVWFNENVWGPMDKGDRDDPAT